MPKNKFILWLIYIISCTVIITFMLCIAEAAYGINQSLNEKTNNENDKGYSTITGMSSASKTAGIAIIATGVFMAVYHAIEYFATVAETEGGKCMCIVFGQLPCWAFFVTAALLIITGIALLSKASDSSHKDSGSAQNGSGSGTPGASLNQDLTKQAAKNKA
jgi:Na+/proline symporter